MKKFLIAALILATYSLQAMQQELPQNCEGMRYAQQAINTIYEREGRKFNVPVTYVDTYEAMLQLQAAMLQLQQSNQLTYLQLAQQHAARQVTQVEVSLKNCFVKNFSLVLPPQAPMSEASPAPSEQMLQLPALESQSPENLPMCDPGIFFRNNNPMPNAEISLHTGALTPPSHRR